MLRAELRKTWSRPLIVTVFILVCLSQVIYVFTNHNSGIKELSAAYNAFGGQMDDSWRNSIYDQYEQLWEVPPESMEDIRNATLEQKAILTAYDYSFFTEMLDRYVDALVDEYGDLAVAAYSNLRTASEKGELVFGSSPAGEIMANQYMITWGFLIFMVILCVDQFSGEKDLDMIPIQSVSKQGRRKLFWTKLLVSQLSAFIAWAATNLVYALTLTAFYGWGNLQSVIQDFTFNACPHNWNTVRYLTVVLILSLFASQLTALVVFLLARIGKSTQRSFALMGGTLILPYLLAFLTDNIWLALWLPCLINNQWLWNGLRLLRLGNRFIPLWIIAGAELMLIAVIAVFILWRFLNAAETDIDS